MVYTSCLGQSWMVYKIFYRINLVTCFPLQGVDQSFSGCRCYRPRYLVKCLLVAVCIHLVVLMIPWPGLTPVRVAVWCTVLTSSLLNLVGEGGASYLRHSCLCPMGTAAAS